LVSLDGLRVKVLELLDQFDLLTYFAVVGHNLYCDVLCEVSCVMLTTGNSFNLSEFLPLLAFEDLRSAGIRPCKYSSWLQYKDVAVLDLSLFLGYGELAFNY
jgi:hypothetical protein